MARPREITDEQLADSASKYTTIKDWFRECSSHYSIAVSRKILHSITKHLKRENSAISNEEIKNSALKYKHYSDWRSAEPRFVAAAQRRGSALIKSVTAHFVPKAGTNKNYALYVFEFNNGKKAYIGITTSLRTRLESHKCKGPVRNEIINGNTYTFKVIKTCIENFNASLEENALMAKYRSDGWVLLNKAKGGALGVFGKKWTLEKVKDTAKKYSTLREWAANEKKARSAATRYRWYQEIKSTFPTTKYWPKDKVIESAKKYSVFSIWSKKQSGASKSAIRNGWISEVKALFPAVKRKAWTREEIIKDASQYATRDAWRLGSSGAYTAARDKGWYDEATQHMPNKMLKPRQNWKSKEVVLASAKDFNSRNEWHNAHPGAVASARTNGWIEEACAHMRPAWSR